MRQKPAAFKRLFISGLQGGAGKTILSIGIIAAWKKCGKSIAPYKKGPDYIDAGWLGLAAGRPCYNLDTFLVKKEDVLHSFLSHTLPDDIAVIEGNRGLYDGIDIHGTTSSAEVAKLLSSPVILCVDCTKSTRTMAAAVLGCMRFDPDLQIKGIILNRIAGARHEKNLRKNIEHYCGIPVVGAVPRMNSHDFPERHMGLVPTPEHILAKNAVNAAADMAEKYLDMKALEEIAESAAESPLCCIQSHTSYIRNMVSPGEAKPRIGIIRDSAFQFYYPDNIEALIYAGAEPVFISAQKDKIFPPVDGLYIGGGFPETHARELGKNTAFIRELKRLAYEGLPIYAECGGLMYLGESLIIDGQTWPMTGILPAVFGISDKPQGLGYTIINVDKENPWFESGMEVRGHEFRYSKVLEWRGSDDDMAFTMKRGTGFINKRDGIFYKNVFATYTHIHALGLPSWAEAMVSNALAYKKLKKSA
jgi:cobyrinic acid a,c-diamide synthase